MKIRLFFIFSFLNIWLFALLFLYMHIIKPNNKQYEKFTDCKKRV